MNLTCLVLNEYLMEIGVDQAHGRILEQSKIQNFWEDFPDPEKWVHVAYYDPNKITKEELANAQSLVGLANENEDPRKEKRDQHRLGKKNLSYLDLEYDWVYVDPDRKTVTSWKDYQAIWAAPDPQLSQQDTTPVHEALKYMKDLKKSDSSP